MSRRREDAAALALLERLRASFIELEDIQATAQSEDVGGVVGNINMAVSYIDASIQYLESQS
jgi:hypothetical protein